MVIDVGAVAARDHVVLDILTKLGGLAAQLCLPG